MRIKSMTKLRAGAALLILALTLSGCETNQQRSAQLERQAKRVHRVTAETGLVVGRESPFVKVLGTSVVHDENGIAAVVRLRNDSTHALRDMPISITLRQPGGRTLYQNDTPGLSAPLTHVPLLLPGQSFDWIDDQISAGGTPGPLSARVGEGSTTDAPTPDIAVTGVHIAENSSEVSAEGTVVNRSSVAQQELVVFAVGLRAGKIVAAGRAVLPNAPANSSTSFQVFFIGNPKGASLQVSAPPTTLG
jgi:hypothetical protein